jgi:hypothetical protein
MLDIALPKRFEGSLAGVIFKVRVDQSLNQSFSQSLNQSIDPALNSIADSFLILDLVDTLPTYRLCNHRQISRFCVSQPLGQVYPALLSGSLENIRWVNRPAPQPIETAASEQITTHPQIGAEFACRLFSLNAPAQTPTSGLNDQRNQIKACLSWNQIIGLLKIDRLGFLPHQLVGEPPYAEVSIEPQLAPDLQRRSSSQKRKPYRSQSRRKSRRARQVNQPAAPCMNRCSSNRSFKHAPQKTLTTTLQQQEI